MTNAGLAVLFFYLKEFSIRKALAHAVQHATRSISAEWKEKTVKCFDVVSVSLLSTWCVGNR